MAFVESSDKNILTNGKPLDDKELKLYQPLSSLKIEGSHTSNVFQTCEKCNDSTTHKIYNNVILCSLCNYGYKL